MGRAARGTVDRCRRHCVPPPPPPPLAIARLTSAAIRTWRIAQQSPSSAWCQPWWILITYGPHAGHIPLGHVLAHRHAPAPHITPMPHTAPTPDIPPTGLQIMVSAQVEPDNLWGVFVTFHWTVWLSILATALLVGVILTFINKLTRWGDVCQKGGWVVLGSGHCSGARAAGRLSALGPRTWLNAACGVQPASAVACSSTKAITNKLAPKLRHPMPLQVCVPRGRASCTP